MVARFVAPKVYGQQQTLVDEAYVMPGRSDDLLILRSEAYDAEPSYERLQVLLGVVP